MISREGHYIQPVSAPSEHNTANLNYSRIKAGWDDKSYITVRVILYHSNGISQYRSFYWKFSRKIYILNNHTVIRPLWESVDFIESWKTERNCIWCEVLPFPSFWKIQLERVRNWSYDSVHACLSEVCTSCFAGLFGFVLFFFWVCLSIPLVT